MCFLIVIFLICYCKDTTKKSRFGGKTRVMYEIWGVLYEIHFLVQFHTMKPMFFGAKMWFLG